jgi:hypothetical protein
MRIDYAPRAIRDLEETGAYYRAVATPPVAAAIAERLTERHCSLTPRP